MAAQRLHRPCARWPRTGNANVPACQQRAGCWRSLCWCWAAVIQLRSLPGLSIHPGAPRSPCYRPPATLPRCLVWLACSASGACSPAPLAALRPSTPLRHCRRASLLLIGDFINAPDAAAARMPTVSTHKQLTPARRTHQWAAAELVRTLGDAAEPMTDACHHLLPPSRAARLRTCCGHQPSCTARPHRFHDRKGDVPYQRRFHCPHWLQRPHRCCTGTGATLGLASAS
jgi:hypothetical protein